MKIIDLLNKIANGEELPKKIKYNGIEYEEEPCYMLYEAVGECSETQFEHLLNDRVEIIEEDKKIEKLGKIDDNDGYIDQNDVIKIGKKVDEIINKVNSLEDK